jgi:hypothetical protein
MDEQDEAVRQTGRRLRAADRARDRAHNEHIDAVLNALRAGRPPTGVADLSPLSAARLRQIARDAGVPPATKGKPLAGA